MPRARNAIGGVALAVDPVGDHLGEPGLRRPPRLQRPGPDDRLLARAREQVGQHVVAHHLLHLVGHAGHGVDDPLRAVGVRERGHDPGAVPIGFGIGSAPTGMSAWRRLFSGMSRPRDPNIARISLDQVLAPLELDAHHHGDRLAGHVVGRRADAPAHDDGVGLLEQVAQRADHAVEVVADLAVVVGVDAGLGQLLTHPRAVGVDDLPEQQLGSDGEDVTAHEEGA